MGRRCCRDVTVSGWVAVQDRLTRRPVLQASAPENSPFIAHKDPVSLTSPTLAPSYVISTHMIDGTSKPHERLTKERGRESETNRTQGIDTENEHDHYRPKDGIRHPRSKYIS